MTEPLISLPDVELEGAAAFEAGRSQSTHALHYGFAFSPYARGSVLHANWLQGYAETWRAARQRKPSKTANRL
jgi:hypothetical protein